MSGGKDLEQIGLVRPAFEELGLDADLEGRLLPQQAEGKMAQHREVRGRVPGADPALVLAKGHVQHPVEPVLNASMPQCPGTAAARRAAAAGRLDR